MRMCLYNMNVNGNEYWVLRVERKQEFSPLKCQKPKQAFDYDESISKGILHKYCLPLKWIICKNAEI